jgi:hypothetical protein
MWNVPVNGGTISLWQGPLSDGWAQAYISCGIPTLMYHPAHWSSRSSTPALKHIPPISRCPTLCLTRCARNPLSQRTLLRSMVFQGKTAQLASWEFFDLWQKEVNGTWGKSAGTVRGVMKDVQVVAHGVRVWRAVKVSSLTQRLVQEL